ncbi:MAG TPA: flagellar protein [Clostridium sp.]|nr:flagellar protein [Clostridium sp.]
MIINHNMNALNTISKYNRNNISVGKAMQGLSSGLRINKSSDDAAGLAISEKMRMQIRGLSEANKNTQDGISLMQVADGAMSEQVEILQRVRELTVQASNDTNSLDDRKVIQSEINNLLDEVERIARDTNFNEVPLLDGEYNKFVNNGINSIEKVVNQITLTGGQTESFIDPDDGFSHRSSMIDFSNLKTNKEISWLDGTGFNYTCCTCDKAYSVKFVKGDPDTSRLKDKNPVMEIDIRDIKDGNELVNKIKEMAYPPNSDFATSHLTKIAADGEKLYIYDKRSDEELDKELRKDHNTNINEIPTKDGLGRFEFGVYGESVPKNEYISHVDIQIGANAGEEIRVDLPNTTLKNIKLDNNSISVLSATDANNSLEKVEDAIKYITNQRGKLGAYTNRLEQNTNNIGSYEENLQAAESSIRDLDMAEGMIELSKNSILTQAAQAMIIQSNEMTKVVMNLAQGR